MLLLSRFDALKEMLQQLLATVVQR